MTRAKTQVMIRIRAQLIFETVHNLVLVGLRNQSVTTTGAQELLRGFLMTQKSEPNFQNYLDFSHIWTPGS